MKNTNEALNTQIKELKGTIEELKQELVKAKEPKKAELEATSDSTQTKKGEVQMKEKRN